MSRHRLTQLAGVLVLGIVLGAAWHRLNIFPFPQLSSLRARLIDESSIGPATGRWREATRESGRHGMPTDQELRQQQLQAIGYVAGSVEAPRQSGVTYYDADRTWNGFNLIVSAHAPEAILADMSGEILHKWSCGIERAWPDFDPEKHFGGIPTENQTSWRRVHLFENGDVLAIFEGIGLIKIDKNSEIIWRRQNGAHHDLYVANDGKIYVLTRTAHINPDYDSKETILEDFITVLNQDGNQLRQLSLLRALRNSPFAPIVGRLGKTGMIPGDIFHTNTIEVIEKDHVVNSDLWEKGTVLISIRQLDLVCLVDLDREAVVWAESDLWHLQHQPTVLGNGNLLVFNNYSSAASSSVIEIDPVTRTQRWIYSGDERRPFFTPSCGACQRLPNGNTLITESDPGRAFEVTPSNEIVWEYVNPHRAGEKNELIATLFEVVRVDTSFFRGFQPTAARAIDR